MSHHVDNVITNDHYTFLCHTPISEFLTCVKRSCHTVTENQFEIIDLFKKNLFAIRSEIELCITELKEAEFKLQLNKTQKYTVSSESPKILNRNRTNTNIVIHGLKLLKNLKNRELVAAVNKFFESTLNINIQPLSVRLLKRPSHSVCIVELATKSEKAAVFRNCHKLKNFSEKISITDDLSYSERREKNATHIHQNSQKEIEQCFGGLDLLIANKSDQPSTAEVIEIGPGCKPAPPVIETVTKTEPEVEVEEDAEKYEEVGAEEDGEVGAEEDEEVGTEEDEVAGSEEDVQNTEIEDNDDPFWASEEVENLISDYVDFGCNYKFSENDLFRLFALFVLRAGETLKSYGNQKCSCEKSVKIPWKRLHKEFGHHIPRKLEIQLKATLWSLRDIWNKKHLNHEVSECFCKHFSDLSVCINDNKNDDDVKKLFACS